MYKNKLIFICLFIDARVGNKKKENDDLNLFILVPT